MLDFIKKILFRNKTMIDDIPKDWRKALDCHSGRVRWRNTINGIDDFLQNEEGYHPQEEKIFAALKATPFNKVRVVIIGQDPYPEEANATGLAFSTDGRMTCSLENIYEAIEFDDVEGVRPESGNLERWAEQGVLLLNSALTLRRVNGKNMHREPWKCFIQAVVEVLADSGRPIHFMLWGDHAKVFEYYIKTPPCHIYTTNHPYQARQGNLDVFLNCRHFSIVNTALGEGRINWFPPEEAREQ